MRDLSARPSRLAAALATMFALAAAGTTRVEGAGEESAGRDATAEVHGDRWDLVTVPGAWEERAPERYADHDGFAWYRAYVKVPERWVGEGTRDLWVESVTLRLGEIGD